MKTHPAGGAETIMGHHNKRLKPVPTYEMETDPAILSRRQKQIDYGKSTPEYHNYCAAVPRDERLPQHPRTPNKHKKYSRRAWDGLVKQWRLNLHVWSDAPIRASAELESMASMSGDELNESFTSGGTEESCSTASSADVAFSTGFPRKFAKGASSSKVPKVEMDDEISDEDSEDGENEEMDTSMNKTLTDEVANASSKSSTKESKGKERSSLSTSWGDEVNEYLDECEKQYDDEADFF